MAQVSCFIAFLCALNLAALTDLNYLFVTSGRCEEQRNEKLTGTSIKCHACRIHGRFKLI
jgi:hypothetical protein